MPVEIPDNLRIKFQLCLTIVLACFGNAPCMVSLAVNIGELAYGEAMVHHCSETQAAHVVTLFKLVTAEFETSPGQLTFYCQYPSIINSSMAY